MDRPWPIGLLGIAVALAIQIILPFAPMPATSADAALRAAVMAGEYPAAWRCRPADGDGGNADHQPRPTAAHDCPICLALQQISACVPPASVEHQAPPAFADRPLALVSIDPLRPLGFSPVQPRAPPALRRQALDS